MREQWACPDLGLVREPGMYLPVEGTDEMFPECPAAYLRTSADLTMLRDRFGREPFAPHLVGGMTHPYSIASVAASEVESGARNVETVSPKVMGLAHLVWAEREKKRENERLKRKH